MLPGDHFVAGLLSFLVAHLAYIVAFVGSRPMNEKSVLLLPYLVIAVGILALLWANLGRLRVAVVVYVAALVTMAWQASGRATTVVSVSTIESAIGAVLFVVSDGVVAINRFRAKFHAAQVVIMSTYVAAQTLIALSVWHPAG